MDQLITLIDHFRISRFAAVAGATLWIHDYILTFLTEFRTIWLAKWSWVKVLFLMVRYIAIIYIVLSLYYLLGPELSTGFCQFNALAVLIFRLFELGAQSCLMIIRVRALYAAQVWVTWLLYSAFVITQMASLAFSLHSVIENYSTLTYSIPLRLCIMDLPKYAQFVFFIEIPLEVLLLAMQLVHYWRLSREISPFRPTPLLKTLYTDGVLFFVATVTLRVWSGLVFILLDSTFWYLMVVLEFSASSAFISRLVLHLNQVSFQAKTSITLNGVKTTQMMDPQPSVRVWIEMKDQPSRDYHSDP